MPRARSKIDAAWRSARTQLRHARNPAMITNLPTSLTWLRIVLIPVFVGIYYVPDAWLGQVTRDWTGMTVFALAAITDWLDGYLAR
ncbi:MAG: CDP-alcohol phosphatidyltransferase family protein, partial [Casimicrobiaceae bacterium]